jgi:hypothetical protein
LIAIFLLYQPVIKILNSVADQSTQLEFISLGGVELKVRASDLPRASEEVGKAIAGLTDRQVTFLLTVSGDAMHGYCENLDSPDTGYDLDIRQPLLDLESRGLLALDIRDQPERASERCARTIETRLTPRGTQARTFLVDLLSSQLK